jgi:hypothetical protein
MGLEIRKTGETLYHKHDDGFQLDAVEESLEQPDLGPHADHEVIVDGVSLPVEEIESLAYYETTGGAEGQS